MLDDMPCAPRMEMHENLQDDLIDDMAGLAQGLKEQTKAVEEHLRVRATSDCAPPRQRIHHRVLFLGVTTASRQYAWLPSFLPLTRCPSSTQRRRNVVDAADAGLTKSVTTLTKNAALAGKVEQRCGLRALMSALISHRTPLLRDSQLMQLIPINCIKIYLPDNLLHAKLFSLCHDVVADAGLLTTTGNIVS